MGGDGESNNNKNPDKGFWGLFGRISAVVFVLAAVVSIVTAIWPPGARVEARGEYALFRLPPDLTEDFLRVEKPLQPFDRRSGEFGPIVSDPERARQASASQQASFRLRYPYQGYYRIVIRNRGTSPASDIALVVPSAGIAEIATAEGSRVDKGAARFALGRLIPGDQITVHYWTALAAPAGLRDFRVIHSAGTARVDFQYATYGMLSLLAENWLATVAVALSLSVSAFVAWVSLRARRSSAASTRA